MKILRWIERDMSVDCPTFFDVEKQFTWEGHTFSILKNKNYMGQAYFTAYTETGRSILVGDFKSALACKKASLKVLNEHGIMAFEKVNELNKAQNKDKVTKWGQFVESINILNQNYNEKRLFNNSEK